MPRLLINEGGQSHVFDLLDDEVTLGRGASNSVQVSDDHASKNHAVIRRVASRLKLVDLESKNGTRVNGEFRNQRWLENGDQISIGAAVFTFDAAEGAGRGGRSAVASRAGPRTASPARTAGGVAGGRAATRRPRREEVEEGEEGEERFPPRKEGSVATVVLAVAGGLAVLAVLFLVLSKAGGRPGNAAVLAHAKQIYARGDAQAAYDYLKRESDPSDVDGYVSVKSELEKWEKVLASRQQLTDEGAASKAIARIEHDRIEQHKNGFTDEALGQRLRQFEEQYRGSTEASMLRRSNYQPHLKLWRLLVKAEGKNPNTEAMRVARAIWTEEGDKSGAIEFLRAHADPSDPETHKELLALVAGWEKIR